jgi:hypothetical protein
MVPVHIDAFIDHLDAAANKNPRSHCHPCQVSALAIKRKLSMQVWIAQEQYAVPGLPVVIWSISPQYHPDCLVLCLELFQLSVLKGIFENGINIACLQADHVD